MSDIELLKTKIKDFGRLEHLGEGASAHVFKSKNDGSVVKVFKPDKCYVAFLQLIKRHPNKHFPKVKKLIKFTKPPYDGLYMIKMEKLDMSSENEWLKTGLQSYFYSVLNTPKGEKFKPVSHRDPDLVKAIQEIVDFLHSEYGRNNCSPDFRRANVMKREDGTWVITDPFYG